MINMIRENNIEIDKKARDLKQKRIQKLIYFQGKKLKTIQKYP